MSDINTQPLNNTNSVAEPSIQPDANIVYKNRLLKDIERTQTFIAQADRALKKLQNECAKFDRKSNHSSIDKQLSLKKDIIASFKVFETLPYIPRKGDSIYQAFASVLAQQLIDEQKHTTGQLNATNTATIQEIQNYKDILNEFSIIEKLVSEKIITVNDKIRLLQINGVPNMDSSTTTENGESINNESTDASNRNSSDYSNTLISQKISLCDDILAGVNTQSQLLYSFLSMAINHSFKEQERELSIETINNLVDSLFTGKDLKFPTEIENSDFFKNLLLSEVIIKNNSRYRLRDYRI